MGKVKPISTHEVSHEIPDCIIEAVNILINKKWDGYSVTIYQDEILDIVSVENPGPDYDGDKLLRKEIFDNHWLDIEPLYRKQGWDVEYDKPGYNESYRAYFIFKPKMKVVYGEPG
jgi:hypothetical protein